ncbi:MAG: N-acetyltransferase [Verrucomicrobia bacterium]|nr:N-acetyltransferase [Verrucomicrobiota bacterium]
MSGSVALVSLDHTRAADRRRFLRLAHRLYRNDPLWVAPLDSEAHQVLAPQNPFFQHARMQLWVAVRHGADVGRIAGIVDATHNAVHGERAAHFGFLESVDDVAVTAVLFEAVSAWARAAGCDRLVGPMNPSINDECGLLIDGFDSSPVLMMTYNPPYLRRLVEAAGFAKAKDLIAFYLDLAEAPLVRLERIAADFRRRHPQLTVRPVLKSTVAADVPKLKRVFNEAWEKNWGAVPLTDGEINLLAERLVPLVVEGLVWIAEQGGEVAGFLLAVPDANEILRPLRGRMLSPGLVKALPYLLGWKQPRLLRVVALGTRREFRRRGLEAMMFAESLRKAHALGFAGAEASWILEDNVPLLRLLEAFSAKPYKTYRVYARPV